MCFSATASFVAAGALALIGAATVRAAPARRFIPLAAIPLLFAAQQACEGALWMTLERTPFHVGGTPLARAFLFFALFVWPAWVPLSLFLVEDDRTKKRIFAALGAGGASLGLWLIGCATLRDANACVAFGNLYYWVQVDAPLKHAVPFVYVAFVAAPLALSSLRGTTLLAIATIASCALSAAMSRAGFVSVWCFFAAALSGVVGLVVVQNRHAPTGTDGERSTPK
jgi:hypothetical protein